MEGFISDTLYNSYRNKPKSIINHKIICRVLGILLLVEVAMFLLCAAVSWGYGEDDVRAFLLTAVITAAAAGVLFLVSRNAEHRLGRRDGYCIATLVWVLFTLFGMLPFCFSGSVDSVADAFFETMSGFTTTGATVLDNIDSLSHGILFWRSLTHAIGGLGIVCFAVALLPLVSEGNVQLFSAEATGVTHDKLHSKISVMVKWIWSVFLVLNIAEIILLYVGGMSMFDAICHAFSTTGTGGFSTKQASIAYWNSPFIEYVIAVFMILSGVNFTLYFLWVNNGWKKMFRDEELRFYLCSVLGVTLIITAVLAFQKGLDVESAFRKALFQVSTLHTSCGFSTDDYMLWPPFTWVLLMYAILAGGCTGSTGGGIKSLRLLVLGKVIRNYFSRLIHPNAVIPVRINNQALPSDTVMGVLMFISLYLLCILVGWAVLCLLGIGFSDALGLVASSMGNAGLAFGDFGPAYSWNAMPDAAKWVLSFVMLIGRLEMFCVLLMFYPRFWKN